MDEKIFGRWLYYLNDGIDVSDATDAECFLALFLILGQKNSRLAVEAESLKAEVRDHAQWAKALMDDPSSEPYVKLLAEITQLRAALEKIIRVSAKDSGYVDYARWQMMMTIARKALEAK